MVFTPHGHCVCIGVIHHPKITTPRPFWSSTTAAEKANICWLKGVFIRDIVRAKQGSKNALQKSLGNCKDAGRSAHQLSALNQLNLKVWKVFTFLVILYWFYWWFCDSGTITKTLQEEAQIILNRNLWEPSAWSDMAVGHPSHHRANQSADCITGLDWANQEAFQTPICDQTHNIFWIIQWVRVFFWKS